VQVRQPAVTPAIFPVPVSSSPTLVSSPPSLAIRLVWFSFPKSNLAVNTVILIKPQSFAKVSVTIALTAETAQDNASPSQQQLTCDTSSSTSSHVESPNLV
jgi:hypothetical protein